MSNNLKAAITFLSVTTVCMTGCGNDDPAAPVQPVYHFPSTENQLMDNFKNAYAQMNYEAYGEALHDEFNFVFQAYDIHQMHLPVSYINKSVDLEIHQNIFSGENVDGINGIASAISEIEFAELTKLDEWQDVSEGELQGTRQCLYNVKVFFNRPGDFTIQVQGRTHFYVSAKDSVYNGEPSLYWQIIRWVDLTDHNKVAGEEVTWGVVRAMYNSEGW